MVYSKAIMKGMTMKHLPLSDHSEQGINPIDFYLCGLYYRFRFKTL